MDSFNELGRIDARHRHDVGYSTPLDNPPSGPPAIGLHGFTAWQKINEADIPTIRFVYGDTYAAGFMTVTIAAPKVGKSVLTLAEGIDAATGRGVLTGYSAAPQRVFYYNAEDDQAVMNGRTVAALKATGIPQSEIVGRWFPVSGMTEGNELVLMRGDKLELNETAFAFLADQFHRHEITIAIFDPLQDLSESPETNEAFRALGKRLRRLAGDTGVAIGVVHHTRKASPGVALTMDDGRGGSALRGVARFNRLLAPMTEAEAAQSGVDDFRRFFRIAEAESNLAPPSSDRNRWFEKVGVTIGNGQSHPTVQPWKWPEAFAGVTVNDACKVRAAIAERADSDTPARESIQATDWAGYVVAQVLGLDASKTSEKARIKAMLRKWLDTKVLVSEKVAHGKKGKEVPFIFPGPNNPSVEE